MSGELTAPQPHLVTQKHAAAVALGGCGGTSLITTTGPRGRPDETIPAICAQGSTMPDISMCRDATCPSRLTCWLFMAPPEPVWQSYSAFTRPGGADRCYAYWEMEAAGDE